MTLNSFKFNWRNSGFVVLLVKSYYLLMMSVLGGGGVLQEAAQSLTVHFQTAA